MPLSLKQEKKFTRIRILKKTLSGVRKAAKRSEMPLSEFIDLNLRVASQALVIPQYAPVDKSSD